MSAQMQNPGVQARASRDLLCGDWSQPLPISSGWQAQLLASRFCPSLWMARDVADQRPWAAPRMDHEGRPR